MILGGYSQENMRILIGSSVGKCLFPYNYSLAKGLLIKLIIALSGLELPLKVE